jgi:hypothetical protein
MEYINYNKNPKGRKTGDCVIRAIATALDETWQDTYYDIFSFCLLKCVMPDDKEGYKAYLKHKGLDAQKMPRRADRTRYTVREFADEIAQEGKTYILSLAGHLTCLKGSKLYDIWDCSGKSVGNYWIVG